MPSRKKKPKRPTYHSPRKKKFSIRKFFFTFFLIVAICFVLFLAASKFNSGSQMISSEDSTWEEIGKPSEALVPEGGGPVAQDITTAKPVSLTVANTGTWKGRKVSVVKDAGFSDIFKAGGGMRSIEAFPDGRLFMGGVHGFAVSVSPDLSSTIEYIVEDSENKNKVGAVSDFVLTTASPIFAFKPVYIQTNLGTLLYRTDPNTRFPVTELVKDSTDFFGYLRNVSLVAVPNSEGVIAYKPNELYHIEAGSMRKWKTPSRPCGFQVLQDTIVGGYYDAVDNKSLFFIKECNTVYLYNIVSSIVLTTPLEVTKVSLVKNFPTQNLLQFKRGSGNVLYIARKVNRYYWVIKNYSVGQPQFQIESEPQFTVEKIDAPSTCDSSFFGLLSFNRIDIEIKSGQPDRMWATQDGQVCGWFLITNPMKIQSSDTVTDKSILANTYLTDITVWDVKNGVDANVYTSHQYLPGQFNSGLVTILGGIVPTSTPTPTPTPIPTKTPTPTPKLCQAQLSYAVTTSICHPTRNAKGVSFACSDGYVGKQTNKACLSVAEWTNIAKRECLKRMSPCKK